MTNENEQTNNTEKAIEPGDLGKLLREYRGIAQLDVNQVADTLCLTPTAINSLETEAFDKLPEPPYIRGYLRNYARLADQNPKHITRVYEVLRGAAPEEENDNGVISLSTTSNYRDVAKPLITPQRFRLALLAGLLLLLGVLTMIPGVRDWTGNVWSNFSTPNNTEDIVELESEVDVKAQNSLNLPSLTDDVPGNLPISPDETDNTSNSDNDTETETNTETSDVSEQEEVASVQSTDSQFSNDSESVNDSAQAAENKNESDEKISTAATDTNVDNSTQEQVTEEQEEGNTNLKFIFAQEVWLRINSKDGSVVYEALHPAGTEKTLTLKSPLKLKVGNAPAMQLFVNGAKMDTTEFTKGSVARFGIE